MRPRFRLPRPARFPLVLTLGSVFVAISLANPVGATSPPVRTFTAPYHPATKLVSSSTQSTCGASGSVSSSSLALLKTGNVSLSAFANSSSSTACPKASADGGISIRLSNSLTTIRNVSVNWSLSWTANTLIHSWCNPVHCTGGSHVVRSTASLLAYVEVLVVDTTPNSTHHTPTFSSAYRFLNLSGTSSSHSSIQLTLNASGKMDRGHFYAIETFVQVQVAAAGALYYFGGSYHYLLGSSFFGMYAQFGATLNWVSVR